MTKNNIKKHKFFVCFFLSLKSSDEKSVVFIIRRTLSLFKFCVFMEIHETAV